MQVLENKTKSVFPTSDNKKAEAADRFLTSMEGSFQLGVIAAGLSRIDHNLDAGSYIVRIEKDRLIYNHLYIPVD
jgi:hypothetical protein